MTNPPPPPDTAPGAHPQRLFGAPHPRGWPALAWLWPRLDAIDSTAARLLLVAALAVPLGGLALGLYVAGIVATIGCFGACIGIVEGSVVGGGLLAAAAGAVAGAWWAMVAWAVGSARWSRRVFLLVTGASIVLFTLSVLDA